jgi:hypothetical protein
VNIKSPVLDSFQERRERDFLLANQELLAVRVETLSKQTEEYGASCFNCGEC